MIVFYVCDPKQQPLTLLDTDETGWCMVEWPRGQGWTKEDKPWRMWRAQLREEPWY